MAKNKIYLTFDMDWANDTVLEYFYNLLLRLEVKATIFVTHNTKYLKIFNENPFIEIGIHPNFNDILLGNELSEYCRGGQNFQNIIDDMMEMVPEAVSYRSHALTVSTPIISYCVKKGLKYDLNMYIFPQKGSNIMPYKRSGIVMVPFIYEDDLWLLDNKKKDISYYLSDEFEAYRVFNFHPIHLYLNSEAYERYESAKKYNHISSKLESCRNKEHDGMETVFIELIRRAKETGMEFGLIKELEEQED